MKSYGIVCMSILFSIFFWGSSATSQSSISDSQFNTINMDTTYLIAHHVGNRPDFAPDIEDNVHGGDYDTEEDPNGDNTPPDPKGQPDEQPDNGGNDRDTDDNTTQGEGATA